jgi:hypothetical protein
MCIFDVQLSRVQSTHWGAWDNGFDVCNRHVVLILFVSLYERHVGIWCRGMNLGQWFDACNRKLCFFGYMSNMWSLTGVWFLDVSMDV